MFKKILSIYLLILIFSFVGCEDFYNFEANKLNNKAQELIEKSEIESSANKKMIILSKYFLE